MIPSGSLLIKPPHDRSGPRECSSLAPALRAILNHSYWLCVVVVEVAGTATTEAGVEVVVLVVVDFAESQPVTDIRAAAAKQASRNVFISIF
jgi:hypothetical protein